MTDRESSPPPTTSLVGGHEFTLVPGIRYVASRPIARSGMDRFTVSIRPASDPYGLAVVAEVKDLDCDAANALIAAFNDGPTSFEGRVWR